ncbi:Asp23/Gls24 family envelope stress response protein [Ruminococcaceae bacterium OttesenSCG-928-L11]|nr:Asp23/Gls24 family envelope stress response protein [Ruminococcaceae bacterium OttesenSCG-928-L11]
MIRVDNHMGTIEISEHYFANLIGKAASECFGVVGMVNSTASQEFRSAVRGAVPDKGVCVKNKGGELEIDLHICVMYGVNIAAIVKSIIHKVTYTVENACGLTVAKVNVYIADMKTN